VADTQSGSRGPMRPQRWPRGLKAPMVFRLVRPRRLFHVAMNGAMMKLGATKSNSRASVQAQRGRS
jgi:hypothetical protein